MKNIFVNGLFFLFLLTGYFYFSGCKKQEPESDIKKTEITQEDDIADSVFNQQTDISQDTIKSQVANTYEKTEIKDTANKQLSRKIIVYYFHATTRCVTCINIENYTQEVVQSKFKKELKDKKVYFKSVNFETSSDEHIIEKYNLTSSSVIVALYEGKKRINWKNLEDVWDLEQDKEKFSNYIETELKQFLKKLKEKEA